MVDPNSPTVTRRGSISCTQLLGGAEPTMEHLTTQAAEIVKTRAELAEREENENGKLTPPSSTTAQRAIVKRKIEGLVRSFSDSFTTTRGTLKRSFSLSGRVSSANISAPGPAMRLAREKDKTLRQTLHTRLIAHIATNPDIDDVTIKIISLYMVPDFPPYIFDPILALRVLESIVSIICPPVSRNPLVKALPKPQVNTAFQDARRESQEATHRLWSIMCKKRALRGDKAPTTEIKTKVIALGIMALMWPRGVKKLGFCDHVHGKCEVDSWALEFCSKPSKETLGCGLFGFLKELGTFDDDRYQPSKKNLKENGTDARDFAHPGTSCAQRGCRNNELLR